MACEGCIDDNETARGHQITAVPQYPIDPTTQGKVCSAESKPPKGFRHPDEPVVAFEGDGWYTVEFDGNTSRFHPEAKG